MSTQDQETGMPDRIWAWYYCYTPDFLLGQFGENPVEDHPNCTKSVEYVRIDIARAKGYKD